MLSFESPSDQTHPSLLELISTAMAISILSCTIHPLTTLLSTNTKVNERLTEMDIRLLDGALGSKDYSVVGDGDVVILPAFGATIQEMQLLDAK